ncbi:MAG: ABC transporter permease [Arachnia sp.]
MRPESASGRRRTSWVALASLILVPLLAVAAMLGLTADDAEASVNAAVVNLDEPVELDGQLVPLGRQLAAAIVDRDAENITWTLADTTNAAEGLKSGEYSAVVVIPEGFSAAATSYAENDADSAEQATIDVSVSDNAPVTDAAIAQEIARLATTTINKSLTESYLDGVYIGFNEVGEQFTSIVDAAQQLSAGGVDIAAGTGQSANGAVQLADGMAELGAGAGELASAGTELDTGAEGLASGAEELAEGLGTFSDGARELDDGIQQFEASMPELVTGVNDLATGADELLSSIPGYADGASQAVQGIGQLKTGIDDVITELDAEPDYSQLDDLATGAQSLAEGVTALDDALQQLAPGMAELSTGLAAMSPGATSVAAGANELNDAIAGLASGAVPGDVSAAADALTTGYDCAEADAALCQRLQDAYRQGAGDGLSQGFVSAGDMLSLGAADISDGATQLARSVQAIDPELDALSTGLSQLAPGAAELVTGADELAAGVGQLATALPEQSAAQLGELKAGLQQISDGAGTLVSQAQPIVDNADDIGEGATALLAGIDQLATEVAALPAGVSQLADGSSELATGAAALATGGDELASGADEFASGIGAFVAGLDEFAVGVTSAATGTQSLADGIVLLSDGSLELAEALGTFATELADGAEQVPSYDQTQRKTLASVVASPVQQAGGLIESGRVALVALLVAAGLWLGALAAFVVVRPIPSTVVTSSAATWRLWAHTVGLPAGIVAVLGAGLGLIAASVLSLSWPTTLGLSVTMAGLGVTFVLANHALAGWLGHAGRGIAVVLLAVSAALGLSSSAPGWVETVALVSPVQDAMLLVRTIIADGGGRNGLVGGAVLIAAITGVLSYLSISTRRQMSAARYRRQLRRAE